MRIGRMLRKTARWPCCPYCRDITPKKGDEERRHAKRRERQTWKKEVA